MDAHKNKAILKKYSAALMSNHKWKKLYSVMSEKGAELCGIEYHFTDTEKIFYGSAPSKIQVWNTAIDDPIIGAGGPIEYKHIEYIVIPRTYQFRAYEQAPLTKKVQNVGKFLKALEEVGDFPITEDEDSIIIHGYKKIIYETN